MKRIALGFLVMLSVALPACPLLAQTTGFGQPLGWVFISDDDKKYSPNIETEAFVPFTIYLMASISYSDVGRPALDVSTGIQTWEASLTFSAPSTDLVVQSSVIRNRSLNLGDATNVMVGLSPAILAAQTPIDLVEYTLILLTGELQDVVITIGPSTPSSFTPAAPGFGESADVGECLNPVTGEGIACKRRFARISGGVINCVDECVEPVEESGGGPTDEPH